MNDTKLKYSDIFALSKTDMEDMTMIGRFLKSKWWHLFLVFYMLAIVAYIIFFAVTQRILMIGFLVSTIFMFGIELWIFASKKLE